MAKAYIRTCEQCGNPHTYCKEDDYGLMVCADCQKAEKPASGSIIAKIDETTHQVMPRKKAIERGLAES